MTEESGSPRPVRRWRRRLLALAVASVVALGGSELLVRALAPQSDFLCIPDPRFGIFHTPGLVGRWLSTEFDVTVRMNAHGFRDRSRALAKPPGTKRVAVLGDSFVEGFQVPFDENVTALCERRLGGPPAVEVLNMGVSGLGTAQEMLLYEELGRRFSPDVVVLCFFAGNDIFESGALEGASHLPRFAVEGGRLTKLPWRIDPWKEGLLARIIRANRLQVLSLLVRSYFGRGRVDTAKRRVLDLRRDPDAPPQATGFEITRLALARLQRDVRADGARFLAVIIPRPEVVAGGAPAAWEERFSSIAGSLGVPVIDPTPAFAAAAREGRCLYFPRDGHLTAAGHAALAEALSPALRPRLGTRR